MQKRVVFGRVNCYIHSAEYQKCGLPYTDYRYGYIQNINATEIDRIIQAEIPDP